MPLRPPDTGTPAQEGAPDCALNAVSNADFRFFNEVSPRQLGHGRSSSRDLGKRPKHSRGPGTAQEKIWVAPFVRPLLPVGFTARRVGPTVWWRKPRVAIVAGWALIGTLRKMLAADHRKREATEN